jgi:cytochrome P450
MKTVEITNYKEVRAALLNRNLKQALYDEGAVVMQDVLLDLHGREHRDRRNIEHRVFRRDFMRYYEKELFPKVLEETLSPLLDQGKGDLVAFGYQVTMNLTADFAGIDRPAKTPDETAALLALVKKFSEGATLVHSTRDKDVVRCEVRTALAEFDEEFLQPSIDRRRACLARLAAGTINEDDLPRDILTVLLRNQDREAMPPDLLQREIAFYLQAGSHSTANATVHALDDIFSWLSVHPEDIAKVQSDSLFVQRCVHESLRLRPASPVAWRQPICPVEFDGADDVSVGDRVILDLHAANRDTGVYGPSAGRYDPHRVVPESREPYGLTFGVGVHTCLGRDLDGGMAQKDDVDASTHQYGIVTLLVWTLLQNAVQLDPDDPPREDQTTERGNWATYPILLNRVKR